MGMVVPNEIKNERSLVSEKWNYRHAATFRVGSWSQSIALVLGREGSSPVRLAGGRVVKALVEGERFGSLRQSS